MEMDKADSAMEMPVEETVDTPPEESDDDQYKENADDEENVTEAEENIYLNRLKDMISTDKKVNPFAELDERRRLIFDEINEKLKKAPKTIVQKAEEKKGRIERRLEDSDKRLTELLKFGEELVTNVKVSNEKRELARTDYEKECSDLLAADLKRENIESMARFNDISSRWSELHAFKEPMAMFEHFEEQKEKIAELMAAKDRIIEQCQEEINRVNAKYYLEQEKQANDVRCLIQRIDGQIELIKTAYKGHIDLLERTIDEERENIALDASTKWNKFYDAMAETEAKKFEIAKEKEMFYKQEIERISAKQEEITRATRIRLEKDAELLEWELRNVKNTVLINSEKLDYNYQVLQKRNEENIIINNQQKRRVAKLTENITALKLKIAASTQQSEALLRKYSSDIEKLHGGISDLEIKSQRFRANNKKKFDLVWAINFKEIQTSLIKVFEIDRILYEQQLFMPWTKPDVDLSDINNSSSLTTSSSKLRKLSSDIKTVPKKNGKAPKNETDIGLMRNIIHRISDRAGFLVEERLFRILEPYTEDEKCLVRIDNIFTALRVKDMKTVEAMNSYFKPYAFCPNCSNGLPEELVESFYHLTSGRVTNETAAETLAKMRQVLKAKEAAKKAKDDALAAEQTCPQHYLVVEPAFVLTALNEFSRERLSAKNTSPLIALSDSSTNLIKFDNETIIKFWSKFDNYIPKEKIKLWTALEHGLNHYLEVLKQREQLDQECSFLRAQNRELKHLLQKFKV